MTSNGHVRALGARIPTTFDFADASPIDGRGVSVLFVAGDDAALAADAFAHVDVKAILLARARRARRHARRRRDRGRRRRCSRRQHERDAVFGDSRQQRQRHGRLVDIEQERHQDVERKSRTIPAAGRVLRPVRRKFLSTRLSLEILGAQICRGSYICNRSIRVAQTLNSGILLVGSSAAFVRLFADCSPPQ
jgi:hypothetical protein